MAQSQTLLSQWDFPLKQKNQVTDTRHLLEMNGRKMRMGSTSCPLGLSLACGWPLITLSHPISLHTLPLETGFNSYHTYFSFSFFVCAVNRGSMKESSPWAPIGKKSTWSHAVVRSAAFDRPAVSRFCSV